MDTNNINAAKLNLPEYSFRFQREGENIQIFDEFRKIWVKLTPEEWVRQNLLVYLRDYLGCPESLTAVEKSIKVNRLIKRFDIVVYNNQGNPLILIECKAPEVKITQKVMDQAGRYNISLKVPYIIISNGLIHICCKINHLSHKFSFLKNIPHYTSL